MWQLHRMKWAFFRQEEDSLYPDWCPLTWFSSTEGVFLGSVTLGSVPPVVHAAQKDCWLSFFKSNKTKCGIPVSVQVLSTLCETEFRSVKYTYMSWPSCADTCWVPYFSCCHFFSSLSLSHSPAVCLSFTISKCVTVTVTSAHLSPSFTRCFSHFVPLYPYSDGAAAVYFCLHKII